MMFQRMKRSPLFLVIAGVIVVAVLAFAWWTISPLFIRTMLVEGPNIQVPAASGVMTDNESNQSMESTAKPNNAIVEATATMAPTAVQTQAVAKNMEEATEPTIAMPAVENTAVVEPTPEPTKPVGPIVLASGNFDHKDSIHYADGQAILVRDAEGNNIVRLQDLAAANGPDLYVYVTEHPDPANSDELHTGGYNLGTLKATNGSFSYTLDRSLDVNKIKSVVIYCKAFSVIFSTATLQIVNQ